METNKKRIVKKKEPTNIQKAQDELEEIYSDLFDKYSLVFFSSTNT